MTETDATVQPLQMPVKFLPYLEKYRIYKIFKVKSNLHIGNYDSMMIVHWSIRHRFGVKSHWKLAMNAEIFTYLHFYKVFIAPLKKCKIT